MNANSYTAPEPPSASIANEMESGASKLRSMNTNTLGAASVAAPPAAPAMPPRPQWKDYAPAELHGWRRFGQKLAEMYTGIPQRQEARRERAYRNATSDYDAEFNDKLRLSQEQRAQKAEERAENPQAPPKEEEWIPSPNFKGPNGEPVEIEKHSGQGRYVNLPQGVQPIKAPAETQEQNKLGFQGVVGKLDAAHLPIDVKSIDKSLDAALKQGIITPQEHASAHSYQAANPTPGTNLTVHVAGQEEGNRLAIDKMFEGKEVLAHMPDGRRVQMSYANAKAQGLPPERLVAPNAKEAQDN